MGSYDWIRVFSSTTVDTINNTTDELVDGANRAEVLVLAVLIPGLLIGVELFVQSGVWLFEGIARSGLYLEIHDHSLLSLETLVSAYLSSFAHAGWSHLLPNLTAYMICLTALYPVAILSKRKTRVMQLVVVLLLVTPLVTAVLSFQYTMGRRTIGFSGVITAFYGFLPVVLFAAVDGILEEGFSPFWSGTVIFLVYTFIFASLGMISAAGVMFLIVSGFIVVMARQLGIEKVKRILGVLLGPGYYPVVWALIISMFGAVAMTYDSAPTVNVVSHLSGYIFGFVMGFLGLRKRFSTSINR